MYSILNADASFGPFSPCKAFSDINSNEETILTFGPIPPHPSLSPVGRGEGGGATLHSIALKSAKKKQAAHLLA
jgi:hypothetical protein